MLKFPSLALALGVASSLALVVVACTAVPGNTRPAQSQTSESVTASAASQSTGPASAEATPDPAKAIVERVCQSCHDIGVLSQTPHTADEWPAIVQRMRSNGADLNSDQAKLVVAYLQKAYVAKP